MAQKTSLPEEPQAPAAESEPAVAWWQRLSTVLRQKLPNATLLGLGIVAIGIASTPLWWPRQAGTRDAVPTPTPQVQTTAPVAQATATPAPDDAARQAAEAQLVGRQGAKFVVDDSPQLTLPVQPGENCDQIKVGVGNRRSYRVAVEDGVAIVIDAVTVNGMYDGTNPGVAWKKGPWSGTLDILDGAICAVPSEWFDWALKHRTDVLTSIRTRYGLSPTPPVRELR